MILIQREEEAGGVNGLRGTGGSQGSITQSLDLWGTNNPPGTSATYLFNGNITTGQWHGSSSQGGHRQLFWARREL